MKTTDKIIQLLKLHGPLTAKTLAEELALTTMGVRQHLQALEEAGDVDIEDRVEGRGRPTRYWGLTEQSRTHFADRHSELSLQLIDSVKTIFGDQGLDKLIEHREQTAMQQYRSALQGMTDITSRLTKLVELRTLEGYMATQEQADGVFWLLENHCPICSAATKCQNFCRSELQQFQQLFADIATVSREEHIIDGARRCAYRIAPLS
ncbi:transcriptional regulator [Shewanella xiamenensis]|jgi:predicted ArsR family transcriptional regulator|uniref:helix-turn-helix transcriptional regulator n=1 Tax=Shewanella TaxID=22 RepID=UPI0004DA2ACD|nr:MULTISPECIES: metalloregulator ArsR/SmtB family transcription factor [Shewanella]KEK27425.1 transcriptional regulator [Shewanella xiamenensis]MCT8861371.1 transcriptional regulator [Shewanella xiamenensis]MDI5877331.1 transcriptional regulator [Shewanella xiamenensis]QQK59019.1 transcriptional regulator [Shewanella sp. LC6]TPE56034.1 transcriptional regulator [Shewanella sp. LC2]